MERRTSHYSRCTKVDFIADEEYKVTPLLQGFADVLNQYTKGFNQWKASETQNILRKPFAPFGLAEGQIFKEYDLIYLRIDMMFWGARNVDGRGFKKEENRQRICRYQCCGNRIISGYLAG